MPQPTFMVAHRQFNEAADKLELHHHACRVCQTQVQPCAAGTTLWNTVIALHGEFLRECVVWHRQHYRGPERAVLLIRKLKFIVRIFGGVMLPKPLKDRTP